jgi:hypothetical protein
MNKISRKMAVAAAAIAVAGTVILTFAQARKHRSAKPQPPKVVPIQSQVSVEDGQTVITLSPEAQKLSGIRVAPLEKASAREQDAVPAMVLSVDGLAKLHAGYIAAKAQLAKTRAQMDVSSKEYTRLKSLYAKNQNISLKALQLAEGAFRTDQADAQAAQQELALEGLMVKESWGGVVEQWMESGDPMIERVLDQKEMLVEMTVPADKTSDYPSRVQMEISGGNHVDAAFVSLFPRVDPRIQGVGLLYRTTARAGLAPGTNLVAHYSAGPFASGVVVPPSAVVWWRGKAWAYEVTAAGRFTRRAVPTGRPAPGGWLVTRGFEPGDRVVTRGAEQLLSTESSQTGSPAAGSEAEGDED